MPTPSVALEIRRETACRQVAGDRAGIVAILGSLELSRTLQDTWTMVDLMLWDWPTGVRARRHGPCACQSSGRGRGASLVRRGTGSLHLGSHARFKAPVAENGPDRQYGEIVAILATPHGIESCLKDNDSTTSQLLYQCPRDQG